MKFEESYRTRQAKQKLERLKNELSEQHKKLVDHYKQANGQPMNDKRGARVFFNKVDQLEDRKSKLVKQIEAQEIISSGKVNQWKKHPTIYFVKGLRKVAIELVDGAFEASSKYAAKTDEEKQIVREILG